MGYLNNATTVLDAVLTKKGRELLARGQNEFIITKFALADDEVDYSLWDETNPLGTDYYGNVIESLPLLEPTSNASTNMRYKLVTRDVGTNKMSNIDNIQDLYKINWNNTSGTGGVQEIKPTTSNSPGGATEEYSFTILNSSIAYLSTTSGGTGTSQIDYTAGTQNISQTVFGADGCSVTAKEILQSQHGAETTIIITGLSYGATRAVTVKIKFKDA
jgi:hypothetical protein